MPAGLTYSLAGTLIRRYGIAMSPVTRELLRDLRTRTPNEYRKLFRSGPYQTTTLQEPLTLRNIDQPTLSEGLITQTPYAKYNPGRTKRSRPAWYINISIAKTEKDAPRLSPGIRWIPPSTIPPIMNPITIEQRGQILRVQQSNEARYRAEGNRQRRDKKAKRYIQALQFVNRTYGTYSEAYEVAYAWKNSANLSDFVEAIAANEAIDAQYGTRAKILREKLYSQPFYQLPVGIDALQTAFRLNGP